MIKNKSKFFGNEKKYLNLVLQKKNINKKSFNQNLEEKFAQLYNSKYAISFNSGTSTLHSSILACGVKPGDEVISPGLTVIMDTSATIHAHAIPKYADINEDDFTICPKSIEKNITAKTKAIIAVSVFGLSPQMDKIKKISKKYKIRIIEDNAESMFTFFKKKIIGSFGDISSYSFENSKHLSSGEGGILTTNNKNLALRLRKLSNHGFLNLNENSGSLKFNKYDLLSPNFKRHDEIGWNYRLSEFQAAVALAQLENSKKLVDLRKKSAEIFIKILEKYPIFFKLQKYDYHEHIHSYWALPVLFLGKENSINMIDFKKKYLKLGGDIIRAAWSVPYLEPVMQSNNFKKINESVYKNVNYKVGICPKSEMIQKKLMIFKTNYRNLNLAKKQGQILEKTIRYFI